ncbi:hypothetical protein EJ08DRAFT_678011 [Tothia fuscella]|uniref:KOW domain-containing protein n=1 Tax=Tothia fuscella TaxID=1048955 RepID=A0A9P4NUD0_9PEZI|nr:hypothetical protein EJ08DRAFT_678011 [Tothia fuscella]
MQRRIPHQCLRQLSTKTRSHQPPSETTADTIVSSLRARNAYTKKHAAKKQKRSLKENLHDSLRQEKHQLSTYTSTKSNILKTARTQRHEDWELGPLAPKRDVGTKEGVKYGSTTPDMTTLAKMEETVKARRQREGRRKKDVIGGDVVGRVYKVHDRVVVIKGKHKGRISTIRQIYEGPQMVFLEELNKVEYTVPPFMNEAEGSTDPYRVFESPFPISDIRLVCPVLDPITNTAKEVIVDTMILRHRLIPSDSLTAVARVPPHSTYPLFDAPRGNIIEYITTGEESRRVEGYGVQTYRVIPHYEQEINEVKDDDDGGGKKDNADKPFYDDDTLLINTEEESMLHFPLLGPPFPPTVLDELRSKYSRFRDRHDEGWIEKRVSRARGREVMMEGRKRLMRTPLEELGERTRKVREREVAKRELGDEVLARIGEAMVRKLGDEKVQARLGRDVVDEIPIENLRVEEERIEECRL